MRIIKDAGLARFFFLLCLFNGLIVGIIKFIGFSIEISPINITVITFFPILLFKFTYLNFPKGGIKLLIHSLLIFILIKLLFLSFTLVPSLSDIMVYLIYGTAILAIYFFINLSETSVFRILKIFRKSFYIFAFIYLVQYLFHLVLPSAFTEIPNLFVEVGVDKYSREIEDLIIYRPNALIGNPITLGFFLNLLLSIELYFWNKEKAKISIVKMALISLMIFLLFSRANILLCLSLFLFNILLRKGFVKSVFIMLILLLISAGVLYSLYNENPYVTFSIDRFLGNDSYAAASTDEHIKDYKNALSAYTENPFIGISPEQELNANLITDGAMLILLLHFGTLGFLLLMFAYYNIIKAFKQLYTDNKDFAPQFILLLIMIPYSILNSALLNKGVLLITAIYIGVFLNIFYKKTYVKN